MRKDKCREGQDALLDALKHAEDELSNAHAEFVKRKGELMAEVTDWMNKAATAVSERDAMARAKETWMAEVNTLHTRLDEISKLAGKELIAGQ